MLPEKKILSNQIDKEVQDYFIQLVREDSKIKHVNYKSTVDHAKEMSVHAWGEKPVDILDRARPREEEAVKQYRIDSWEPITLSKFDKAIYILQKIFNPKLYSISFPPQPGGVKLKEEESLEYYTRKMFPQFDDVFNYASEVLLKQMIADPNGVISIVPTNYNLLQTDFQTPVVVLWNSSQVLDKKDGVYFVLKDANTYQSGNREGVILHIFTKNSIITYNQIFERDGNGKFVEAARYDHNFNMLPAWHLGGVTDSRTHPYSYKSFFNAALPYWNKAIRFDSDLDGAYVNHLHHQKWELTVECEHRIGNHVCDGGQIYNEDKKIHHACPKCKGEGTITVKSPYDVYKINPNQFKSFGDEKANIPFSAPAGYVTVPTDIVNILKETVKDNLEQGLSAICMDVVNKIGENQSGVAKDKDRSELYSFMAKVSDYLFDNHIPNIFYFINKYRYEVVLGARVDEYLPKIGKPSSFDILSIQELTEEISKAKENNANSIYLTALETDLISKRFTDEVVKNEALLAMSLNPFPNVTSDDKGNMLMNGTASKVDIVISDNINQFIKRAIEEVKNFIDLLPSKQREILKGYANEIINSGNTQIGDILTPGFETNTPVDIEAEAKAKLKGSVGGVQGILAIQQQVSEGVTPYPAGLAILELIYGIGGEEGKRILGDENEIKSKIQAKSQTVINATGQISE